MSGYKYTCPYCGQHIEYTDGYAGQQMPCPICQQIIMFPAIPAGLRKSSLRLVRDIPKPVHKSQFSFAELLVSLREFKHWKVVATCLIPFAILIGALMAANTLRHTEPPSDPSPIAPPTAANSGLTSDAQPVRADLNLMQASQQVQPRLAAVKKAGALLQAAEKNQATVHQKYNGSAAGKPFEDSCETEIKNAQKNLDAAKTAFTNAFTNYQHLGGPIDYSRQLP